MQLHLFNTASKQKELFQAIDPSHIKMYVCGPTVYNYIHIGNARPAVVFDCLFRLLQNQYAQVSYARNITDVDDKINAAAAEQGVSIAEFAEKFTQAYQGEREFRRLQDAGVDLNSYNCNTIFVDPPRSGMDIDTCKMVQNYERIMYISCSLQECKVLWTPVKGQSFPVGIHTTS